jgi:hypothetical protein
MQIAVEKETKTPAQMNDGADGQRLIMAQFDFDDVNKAKQFFVEAQSKYGKAENQEYFSLENGAAAYSTNAIEEDGKFITYTYYLDGFEGDLLKMIKSDIKASIILSRRDLIAMSKKNSIWPSRKAGIDYNKIAETDAVALEKIVKNLQAYLLSGKKDLNMLETYRSQMMDVALDLNEVIGNLENETDDGLAGLGAGASRKQVGLNRKASVECKICGEEFADAYAFTEHENSAHAGQKQKPGGYWGWANRVKEEKDIINPDRVRRRMDLKKPKD